jgi:hypothetical protein
MMRDFEGFNFHNNKGDDDREKADGVDEKADAFAGKGNQQARDGWSD